MKNEVYHDEMSRSTMFKTIIDQRDMLLIADKNIITTMIRMKITEQVANHVMERLGPAIDKALNEILVSRDSGEQA